MIKEQAGLGLEVGLHRAVIIDVIAAQVRKDRGVEGHAGDPRLLQRMRRDFDRGMFRAEIAETGEEFVQRETRRCRHGCVTTDVADARAERADVTAGHTEQFEAARCQPGDGRLAVRARHAGDPDGFTRRVEPAVRDIAEPRRQAFDRDHRHVRIDGTTGRGVPRNRGDAGSRGLIDKIEAVRGRALAGDEQVTGLQGSRVGRAAADGYRRRIRHTLEQMIEGHAVADVGCRHAH